MFTIRTIQNGEETDKVFDSCTDAWQEFGKAIERTAQDMAQFESIAWPVTTIAMAYMIDAPMPTYYAMVTMA